MLRRLGFTGVAVACVLSCGGHSDDVEQPRQSDAGKGGAMGAGGTGGQSSGVGGCAPCGAVAGSTGEGARSASGSAGATDGDISNAGSTDAGASSGGAAGGPEAGQAGEDASGGSASGGRAGGDTSGGSESRAGASDAGAGGEAASSDTLGIVKVAVYQATEVTLMKDGVATPPNAPIVAAREALLRVWVAPSGQWTPGSVTAELDVTTATSSRSARDTATVSAASVDDELGSTFAFTLRASEVTTPAALAVTLRRAGASDALARWPTTGDFALAPASSNGDFQVTLVPLVAGGITPDVGPQMTARFQRYLGRVYPVPAVDMTVHAPVTLDADVLPDGTGWDDALDALYAARDADAPDPNVYYYGVLTPTATFEGYCTSDCVVGLSTVAALGDEEYRAAIGTGYFESNTDTSSQETMAHELGHALGREHAPCGDPDDVDRKYPYSGGQIGVTGYDGSELLDKDAYKDEMSYCVPVWISDYTWSGIFGRISDVNGIAPRLVGPSAPRARYRTLALRGDGSLHWGSERAPASAPAGERLDVELLDGAGAVLDVVAAPFMRFDHLPGGLASVPARLLAAPDVASVRVNGVVLPVR